MACLARRAGDPQCQVTFQPNVPSLCQTHFYLERVTHRGSFCESELLGRAYRNSTCTDTSRVFRSIKISSMTSRHNHILFPHSFAHTSRCFSRCSAIDTDFFENLGMVISTIKLSDSLRSIVSLCLKFLRLRLFALKSVA